MRWSTFFGGWLRSFNLANLALGWFAPFSLEQVVGRKKHIYIYIYLYIYTKTQKNIKGRSTQLCESRKNKKKTPRLGRPRRATPGGFLAEGKAFRFQGKGLASQVTQGTFHSLPEFMKFKTLFGFGPF